MMPGEEGGVEFTTGPFDSFFDEEATGILQGSMASFENLLHADGEGSPLPAVKPAEPVNRPETKPRLIDEDVQFTVFQPQEVAPEVWCDLLAFAHLGSPRLNTSAEESDPLAEVERQARQILGNQMEDFRKLAQNSTIAFPEDGEVTFAPELEHAEFNPPRITFLWKETVHRAAFRFRVDGEAVDSSVRGSINVYLGPFLAATIALRIKVGAPGAATGQPVIQPKTVAAYRNIFVSYAHRDKAIVDICQHYAKAFGDRFLRDCVDLRAGQQWNDGLLSLIEKADVFQLFWSANARDSDYVRQEVAHALQLNRPGFIRPTYWEADWPRPWSTDPDISVLHFERLPFAKDEKDTGAAADATPPVKGSSAPPPDTAPVPQLVPEEPRPASEADTVELGDDPDLMAADFELPPEFGFDTETSGDATAPVPLLIPEDPDEASEADTVQLRYDEDLAPIPAEAPVDPPTTTSASAPEVATTSVPTEPVPTTGVRNLAPASPPATPPEPAPRPSDAPENPGSPTLPQAPAASSSTSQHASPPGDVIEFSPLRTLLALILAWCTGTLLWYFAQREGWDAPIRVYSVGGGSLLAYVAGLLVFRIPEGTSALQRAGCLSLCLGMGAATWWVVENYLAV